MDRITLSDLIEEVSIEHSLDKNTAHLVIRSFLDKIKIHVLQGNVVVLWNFGVFKFVERKARKSFDVNSGTLIKKDSTVCPKFTFAKRYLQTLKEQKK